MEELEGLPLVALDELPIARADYAVGHEPVFAAAAVVGEMPVEGVPVEGSFAIEDGSEVLPVDGASCGQGNPRRREQGREVIDAGDGDIADRAGPGDTRPADDRGDADAALVRIPLPGAEGGVVRSTETGDNFCQVISPGKNYHRSRYMVRSRHPSSRRAMSS
jgi:hypothetical protein